MSKAHRRLLWEANRAMKLDRRTRRMLRGYRITEVTINGVKVSSEGFMTSRTEPVPKDYSFRVVASGPCTFRPADSAK